MHESKIPNETVKPLKVIILTKLDFHGEILNILVLKLSDFPLHLCRGVSTKTYNFKLYIIPY